MKNLLKLKTICWQLQDTRKSLFMKLIVRNYMYFLDYFFVQQQSKFYVTVYQYLLVLCFVFIMIKYCILIYSQSYNPLDKDHKNFWLDLGITRVMHVRLKLINHKIGTMQYFNFFVPVIFLLLLMY